MLATSRGMIAVKPGTNGAAPVAWKSIKLGASTPSPLIMWTDACTRCEAISSFAATSPMGNIVGSAAQRSVLGFACLCRRKSSSSTRRGSRPSNSPVKKQSPIHERYKDTILATPSIANGSLYLRSDKFIYRIAASKKSSRAQRKFVAVARSHGRAPLSLPGLPWYSKLRAKNHENIYRARGNCRCSCALLLATSPARLAGRKFVR